jgi:hypothetical protein
MSLLSASDRPLGGCGMEAWEGGIVMNFKSVLVAGLGNIGSHLPSLLLQSGCERVVIVDRDCVEEKNLLVQRYAREDIGRSKAEALAGALRDVRIEARVCDLEDVGPEFLDVDLVLGALDSRRARQVLMCDLAWRRKLPVIDGGVGDNGLGRVQVFVAGEQTACLECTWGQADYRLAAAEYPCRPGAKAEGRPTGAPAWLGMFTASLMVREALHLEPTQSYEIAFDLTTSTMRRFALRRASRCRFDHR